MTTGCARRARPQKRPSGLYHTRTRSRNFPQLTDFKRFRALPRLTLSKTGTYTDPMTPRRVLVGVLVVSMLACVWSRRVAAQAIQKSLYVSVVDDAGQPVPGLGPRDFVVREDNAAREVLTVRPADEPMQIALLVDTSQVARNDISHMRTALPPFVAALTSPNESGAKNQIAIIAFGERPTVFTEYTSSPAPLQKGIDRIWAQQGSGPYFVDAVYEVVEAFKKRGATRPVIVAIVAEGGEMSYRQYDQVLDPLRARAAPLYALMIGS